jgi:CBS domain-containing protein
LNILFFLTPKHEIAYVFEDDSLQQAMEKMEYRRFSCIPILTKDGKFAGTLSEGDLLWALKRMQITDEKDARGVSILSIPKRAAYKPVRVDTSIEDLLDRAINQNFVPVIDDQDAFIGIVTRKAIIKYCYEEMQRLAANLKDQG